MPVRSCSSLASLFTCAVLATGASCLDRSPGQILADEDPANAAETADSDVGQPDAEATALDVAPSETAASDAGATADLIEEDAPARCAAGLSFYPPIVHVGETVTLCGPGLSPDSTVTLNPFTDTRATVAGLPVRPGNDKEVAFVVDVPEPDMSHTFYRIEALTEDGTLESEMWLEVRPKTVAVETSVSFAHPFAFAPNDALVGGTVVTLFGEGFVDELVVELIAYETGAVLPQSGWQRLSSNELQTTIDAPQFNGFYRVRLRNNEEVAMSRVWLEVHPTP